MTAVEVIDPTDRYTISGSGYGLEGRVEHAAGSSDTIEDAILPFLSPTMPSWSTEKWSAIPPRGRC